MHYVAHLSADPVMKKLIEEHGVFTLKKKKTLWLYLCYSIMSQQLSTKVADVIKKRFLSLYNGEPNSQQVVDTSFDKLRGIGMSNAKVSYVQNVARFEIEHGMDFIRLNKMSNEEVIDYLTQIKGVGKWTVEMLLMFALGREDLFAIDDLGLRNAVIGLYKLNNRKKKTLYAAILKKSIQWAPFRTYACLYLWRSLDNNPKTKVTREKKPGNKLPGKNKTNSI